jgi:hypothetical protein
VLVGYLSRKSLLQEHVSCPITLDRPLLLNSKPSVKEEMRALVEKFPLGYEGYIQELHRIQEDSAKPLTNETVVLLQCVDSPGLASSNANTDSV